MSAAEHIGIAAQKVAGPKMVRVPEWEQYPWLRAGFSTRRSGLSSVYGEGELNLGWTKEDDPALVAQNRAAFVEAVADGAAMSLVTVGQVHRRTVRDLEVEPGPLMTPEGKAVLEGDGLISRSAGRLLAILTADCVPVLVVDTQTRAVGAFHAGWRGTVARIVEHGIAAMRESYGSRPEDLRAAIGPCIGPCCFEVGDEVGQAFEQEFAYGGDLARRGPTPVSKLHLDLVEANVRQLQDAGIGREHILAVGACTACSRTADGQRTYYSYRAEAGRCGRMLSAIGTVAL